jgi:flagellar M-ring protein FliF
MSMTDTTNDSPRGGAAANLAALKDRAGKVSGAFDRKQRTVMAAVFAATIGAVLAFSFLGSRTDWAPLMTNLAADDASAVTKQLDSLGTEYRLADGGATVEVPSDVVYQTRIDIASVDMPSSGKVGYGILDNQDITSSEFSQRIGFQRAMEGELAKTIEAIDGVNVATVHLAIPKNDTFALDEQKATASVMVKTAPGKTLAGRQVQAIVNLVSGGIEGLSPTDVTVADGEGNVLAAPGTAPGSGAGGDAAEMTSHYETTLASSIEDMLGSVVGPGKAKVTVAAALDFDSTSSTTETYSAPTTIVAGEALAVNESIKTETYSGDGTGSGAAGILGPDGLPLTSSTQGAAGAAGSGYQLNEKQVNNAVNKVVENTNKAPGAVERLSVAVIVDEKAVDATQLPEIERLVTAAAGLDTSATGAPTPSPSHASSSTRRPRTRLPRSSPSATSRPRRQPRPVPSRCRSSPASEACSSYSPSSSSSAPARRRSGRSSSISHRSSWAPAVPHWRSRSSRSMRPRAGRPRSTTRRRYSPVLGPAASGPARPPARPAPTPASSAVRSSATSSTTSPTRWPSYSVRGSVTAAR